MSKFSFYGLRGGVCVALLFACLDATQAAASDPILAARAALRAGDSAKLERSLEAAHGHVLESYVWYWSLVPRIGQASGSEITAFLHANAGTLLAETLRSQWLKYLGSHELWDEFDIEYPRLARIDRELQCYALQSRLARDETGALDAAGDLWLSVDLPQACDGPLAALHAAQRVSNDDVWSRVRRLLDDGQVAAAGASARFLAPDERPDSAALAQVAETPDAFLDGQDFLSQGSGMQQELAAAALARLARSDVNAAAVRFAYLESRLRDAQRQYVYAQLGWQAARRHLPEALVWYKAAGDSVLSDEQIAWKVRAALRAADWQAVLATIDAMPPQLSTQPDWIYWRARALDNLGRAEEAQLLYRAIAGQSDFYGNLADEELGHTIDVPTRAAAPSHKEIAEVTEDPGIARALALRRIGLRTQAIREWNWALRGQNDRFLLAAAEYARRNQMFDRAISAAERTQAAHDFTLRYLAPFRDEVEPQARARDLDQAWVYGLIRQESRFVADARSGVGASGLMQLMPATAKWLGRKLGMRRLTARRISDRDTNIVLGTSYLKLVLADLDDQPLVASAAYNAGPGRAKRWRGDQVLEGAIYAETIPFGETRDYVKKVMSNAVYYAALFEGKPQSLKARLGVIGSRAKGRFLPKQIASAQGE